MHSLISFFTDPILRPSTIGSIFMCLSSALVGVIVYLRKRSLLGEALSHTTFPGVILGILIVNLFFPYKDQFLTLGIIIGATGCAFLGLRLLEFLEKKKRVHSDSALCFILSSFFGAGVFIASRLQQIYPLYYKQALVFLYGQAATMTNIHIGIYGGLFVIILSFIIFFYRYLETVNFDPDFAETLGIRSKKIDQIMFFLVVLAIVIGIRSVGVVLMAGMLMSPAIAAKPLTKQLSHHLIVAALFGVLSGFLGNYLSVIIPQGRYSLPTGPMILLVSSIFCFLTLCLSPTNGLVIRYFRLKKFQFQCSLENSLKYLWKNQGSAKGFPKPIRRALISKGWIGDAYDLTNKGKREAEKIIRLHRLWEVYLVDYLGQKVEKVHQTAEELEHLISSDLEKQLSELLKNPKKDPHSQPIPPHPKEGLE